MVHINECLYYHYCIKNSAGGKYTYHSYKLIISYLQRLKNYLIDQNMYQLYHKYYADGVLIFLFYAFRNETKHKCYKTLIQEIRKIRKNYMLQYELHSLVKDKGLSLLKEYSVWKCIYLIMIYGFIRTKSYSV